MTGRRRASNIGAGAAGLCLFAAGCAAPQPKLALAPEVLSTEWRGAPAPVQGRLIPVEGLGQAFDNPALQGLIARALQSNADIAVARARVAQARSQLAVARAAMLPAVSASAGLTGTRSDNERARPFDFSQAFAGLDVSFDTDLFGGNRAGRRAARTRVSAAAFDRQAAALVVEAEVARAFIQHAALADRIALLDRSIGTSRELERIVRVRLREGVATRVDTGLQAIEVRQLEAERTRLAEAQEQTHNALAVLVGEEAPRFEPPQATLVAFREPAFVPVQPGALLVRRPDIQAAEARISAARGDVERARAAFLPNLRLTASSLVQAATLTGPFGATVSAGANLLAPIFQGGRLRGELSFATATQVETVELYRRALLVALREAQDALSAVEQSRRREALLAQAVEEARTTARLRRLQFIEGAADLRDVLEAQRFLVQAEDARAITLQERMNAAIDLYRAMGGTPRA